MRHEVVVKGGTELQLVYHSGPMQGVAIGEQCALIGTGNLRQHLERARIQSRDPPREGGEELLWINGKGELSGNCKRKLLGADPASLELPHGGRVQPPMP